MIKSNYVTEIKTSSSKQSFTRSTYVNGQSSYQPYSMNYSKNTSQSVRKRSLKRGESANTRRNKNLISSRQPVKQATNGSINNFFNVR